MSNIDKVLSSASIDASLQRIISDNLGRNGYDSHAVFGLKFRQRNVGIPAFTLGGKIPKIAVFNNPEFPIGVIYISNALCEALSTEQLEYVILHELGHIINNHVVAGTLIYIGKTMLVDWLADSLEIKKSQAKDIIGILKIFLGRKTIEEEITKQNELSADAYAVTMQGRKEPAISVLQRLSDENLEAPTHVTRDGRFVQTALTFRERIEAIQRL